MRESAVTLKLRADISRSPKQGYQLSQKRDYCPPDFFLKKLTSNIYRGVEFFNHLQNILNKDMKLVKKYISTI